MASMKQVNIAAQQAPDSQSMAPAARMRRHRPGPCHSGSKTKSAAAVKALRQKVSSKLRVESSWRVTTPAVLHRSVTSTISPTA